MTWSLERFVVGLTSGAAVAAQGIWDAFTHRPGHDADLPLPDCPNPDDCREYSCAGECSESDDPPGVSDAEMVDDCGRTEHDWLGHEVRGVLDQLLSDAESFYSVPEPPLTSDELVAIRQLIEDRFPHFAGATETSPPAVSDDPAGGERAAGVEYPPIPPAAHPKEPGCPFCPNWPADCDLLCEAREQSWLDWAVPAIGTTLDAHQFAARIGTCLCGELDDGSSLYDWEQHVAPLIAGGVACCPDEAIAALQGRRPK